MARRTIRSWLTVTAIALGSLAAAAPAAADEPCDPSVKPALDFFDLPPQIVSGRDVRFFVDQATGSGRGNLFGFSATVTVAAADASRPIAHPYSVRHDPGVTPRQGDPLNLRLDPGDGPANVSATWQENDNRPGQFTCTRTITQTVAGGAPGEPPVFGIRAINDSDGEFLSGSGQVVGVVVGPRSLCGLAPTGPLQLRLTSGGRARTSTLSEVCGRWSTRDGPGWSVETFTPRSNVLDESGLQQIVFVPGWRSDGTRRVRYELSFGARRLAAGTISVTTDVTPDRRIYRPSDAYQNYCRNRHRRIYQSRGRKFCIQPGSVDYAVRIRGTGKV